MVVADRRVATGRSCPHSELRWLRWVYRVASLIAVAPITVAAIRDGLRGWEPTWDAATTAVRVRDVFSAHPPLIGFAAAPSRGTAALYSFPGALEPYLLAVPVRLLGTTWGLLLGMAALNTAALLVGLWLIRRRVGESGAILGAAFIASLLWTLGSEILIDPTPIQAGILPFLTFLVAAWSVADGDDVALIPLAAVGNYLVLDQLKFALVVPIIGAVALGIWAFGVARRPKDDRWRSVALRWFAVAVGLTVVTWVPPIIDQVAGSGNLSKLFGASTGHGPLSTTVGPLSAFSSVMAFVATPPFWLPPSFAHSTEVIFIRRESLLARSTAAAIVVAGVLGAHWLARRHRNPTLRRGLTIAVAGLVGWSASRVLNPRGVGPNPWGLTVSPPDFWGLWPLSTFFWFLIGLVVVRIVAERVQKFDVGPKPAAILGCATVVVLAGLASHRANNCTTACASGRDELVPMARSIRRSTAPLRGQGPVEVVAGDVVSRKLIPTVLLGLQDADVEFRVSKPFDIQQFGADRSAPARHDATVKLVITRSADRPSGARVVARARPGSALSETSYRRIDGRMHAWADRVGEPVVNSRLAIPPSRRRELQDRTTSYVKQVRAAHGTLLDDERFVGLLIQHAVQPGGSLFAIPGVTADQLRDWAAETRSRRTETTYVYEVPIR